MQNFRSLQLAIEFYAVAKRLSLPPHHRDQMLRAASSIALNLAEGSAKSSVADRKRFYQIAFGSLRECQTILKLESVSTGPAHKLADHLGACLYKLTGH